jgi:hypothetical protein
MAIEAKVPAVTVDGNTVSCIVEANDIHITLDGPPKFEDDCMSHRVTLSPRALFWRVIKIPH